MVRTIYEPCVNDLLLSSVLLLSFTVSTEKISLAYRPLGFLELDPLSLYKTFLSSGLLFLGCERTKKSCILKMIRNVIIGSCGFHSRGPLLTFLWRLPDVLECSANTSCQQEASNLGLKYLCKLVQPANLHKKFFRRKARHD